MSAENWKEEDLIDTFYKLIKAGTIDNSSDPFRLEVSEKIRKISEEGLKNKTRSLRLMETFITNADIKSGYGIISSSPDHDFEKETLATAYVASIFIRYKQEYQLPLIFNIDDIYSLPPYEPSLVGKIIFFEHLRKSFESEKKYLIILTGLSRSKIFEEKILNQVPNQENARLTYHFVSDPSSYPNIEFGEKLYEFSNRLPQLFLQKKGVINEIMTEIKKNKNEVDDKGLKLLMVTGLLLQDRQRWQTLWFEGQDSGTFLFIVAPSSFHHAMNRLNAMWGHGAYDYFARASLKLPDPIFEESASNVSYERQGLNSENFIKLTKPWLDQFALES